LSRIYNDLIKIEAEPADEALIELVHPHSHIQKVKDTQYDSKDLNKKVPLESKKNTRRFKTDTYENKFTS
jgi:histone deacetylase 6